MGSSGFDYTIEKNVGSNRAYEVKIQGLEKRFLWRLLLLFAHIFLFVDGSIDGSYVKL